MPRFDFFCSDCGLLFDKIVPDSTVEQVECKSCSHLAKKTFKPHAVGVTYKDGVPPTASIDQLVGSDAEKRWGTVNSLHTKANEIRKSTNSHVVEVSSTGELKAASPESVKTRRDSADIVINNQ